MTLTTDEAVIADDLDHAILTWRYTGRTEPPALTMRSAGGMTVSRLHGGPCVGWRDSSTIRSESRVYIGIGCNLGGSEICYMEGTETCTSVGDIMMWRSDAELAFEVRHELSKVTVLVPAEVLAARYGVERMPPAWHLRADSPMGVVASALLSGIANQLTRLPDAGVEIALDGAVRMISRSIVLDLHATDDPREAQFFRITADLEQHLREDLTPSRVAARHGMSLRYLQMLFSQRGTTFSGWVRERRLQAALTELTDATRARSITEIAQRWRFADGAHFSRLFKERFGASPSVVKVQGDVARALVP